MLPAQASEKKEEIFWFLFCYKHTYTYIYICILYEFFDVVTHIQEANVYADTDSLCTNTMTRERDYIVIINGIAA